MKWNDRLKAMRAVATQPEKQNISVMTTAINCQNPVSSPFGSSQFGHSSKFGCDLSPVDLEIILQERIAIMIFDGGLSEAEAVQIARRESGV